METTPATGGMSGPIIGIDLGGTKLLAGLMDDVGRILHSERVLVADLDQDALVNALVATVDGLVQRSTTPVLAAGFGIPTTIDQRTGTAVLAANLPIKNLALLDILGDRLGIPIFMDNDANVAALAEARRGAGVANRVDDLVMVTLGTGFGGGIVANGQIVRGAIGGGAELGHMIIDFDGPPCVSANCGGIGCIETFVGGGALARDVRSWVVAHPESTLAQAVAAGAPARGETVLLLANEGDADSRAMLERMGMYLGIAFVNFSNVFGPELIVVGGGLTPALDYLLPVAEQVLRDRALPPGDTFTKVVRASFGENAGMVGASLMAREALRAQRAASSRWV